MLNKKILIMGLPGSGKTTLALMLAARLQAVHFNADEVRQNINRDLGFSLPHREEHARRMGWLCDQVVSAGHWAIADFVCPTGSTRAAFGASLIIWCNTIRAGRFEDTNQLFEPPASEDLFVKFDKFDAERNSAVVMEMIDQITNPLMLGLR